MYPPIYQAAVNNDSDTILDLIVSGSDVNVTIQNGATALMQCAYSGNFQLVALLHAWGADINKQTNDGETALMNAAKTNQKQIIEFLISKGANINASTTKGLTALSFAAISGSKEALDTLVHLGADFTISNDARSWIISKYSPWMKVMSDNQYFKFGQIHPKSTIKELLERTSPLTAEEKRILNVE